MKVDFDKFDGQILLFSDRRRGIWSNEIVLKNSRNTRTAGQAPVSTSAHGLLVLALINGLQSTSKRQTSKAVGHRSKKARLNIVSSDRTFADALRAMITGDKATLVDKPFRAGRNLLRQLARDLARFDVTLTTDHESYAFQALGNFARLHVRDPKELDSLPSILVPVVASTVV